MSDSVPVSEIVIEPFRYKGTLKVPASKSYLQRSIALAALCEDVCTIENFYPSNDALAALHIAKNLGARIQQFDDVAKIQKGANSAQHLNINCGESGLSTRMFSPIACLFGNQISVHGTGSLLQRPIVMIEDALRQFGLETKSNNGFLPLEISGQMHGAQAEIDGSESSQLLTGLLMSLPLLNQDSVLHVSQLKSKPYIQMTLDLLSHFGIIIEHQNLEQFTISGNQKPKAEQYFCEGDWSGAAFHLVGAAISGEVTLLGLNPNSAQADRAILKSLEACGVEVEVDSNEIRVKKNQLQGFQFDATHCPDLFPSLAVLAACCEGTSEIKGVSRLRHKESDRAATIQSEFAKLNISVILDGDVMRVSKSIIQGGQVHSHNDHRIAMALAVLASVSDEAITIQEHGAVKKSYPTFFEDLVKLRGF